MDIPTTAVLAVQVPEKTPLAKNKVQPFPFITTSPAKKQKNKGILERKFQGDLVDVLTDPSWREYVKCKKRVDGTIARLIRTVSDDWYPLNKVLNGISGLEDPDRVVNIGFDPTLTAIKCYGVWSAILAHLAESTYL